jgi:hypothetical protein
MGKGTLLRRAAEYLSEVTIKVENVDREIAKRDSEKQEIQVGHASGFIHSWTTDPLPTLPYSIGHCDGRCRQADRLLTVPERAHFDATTPCRGTRPVDTVRDLVARSRGSSGRVAVRVGAGPLRARGAQGEAMRRQNEHRGHKPADVGGWNKPFSDSPLMFCALLSCAVCHVSGFGSGGVL